MYEKLLVWPRMMFGWVIDQSRWTYVSRRMQADETSRLSGDGFGCPYVAGMGYGYGDGYIDGNGVGNGTHQPPYNGGGGKKL